MPNKVEEQLRAIDNTIGYHKLKIKELNKAKMELMDKYDIPYTKEAKIIERNTAEREEDIKKLFEECKPLLEEGLSLRKAVMKIKGKESVNTRLAWYRELKQMTIDEGFDE